MTNQAPAQGDMSTPHEMKVLKRNLSTECISFDKVTKRIRSLSHNLCVDPTKVSQKVIEALFDGVSTRQIDELAAQISASMSLEHPHYNDLAGRIAVSNHQKNTTNSFFKTMKMLYDATDINGEHHPIVSKELFKMATNHKKEIEETIDYERDYLYDYFGFKTLEKSYLMRLKGQPVERIQHMWMRVALAIHEEDLVSAFETYHLMSQKYFTHATPTLFNSGTPRPQLSSCFLLQMKGDSVPEIFQTLEQCAQISKWAGGIGLHVHNIRAKGSYIRGTNGVSNGLVPMLRTYNACSRYIDQCLGQLTGVYTVNGLKNIASICCNDLVLGEDGEYHRVRRVLEHVYQGEIIVINTHDGARLQSTPSQQIYSQRPFVDGGTLGEVELRDAKEMLINDCIVQKRSHFLQDVCEWTIEDCWILGMLLRQKQETPFQVAFSNQSPELLRLTSYLQDRMILHDVSDQDNKIQVSWRPCNMFPFTTRSVCDGLPSAALHLPKDKAQSLRAGLGENVEDPQIKYLEMQCNATLPVCKVEKVSTEPYDGYVYDLVLEHHSAFMTTAGLVHHALPESQDGY